MTKQELVTLNAELIEMLVAMREQIDDKLAELEAVEDDDDDPADDADDED